MLLSEFVYIKITYYLFIYFIYLFFFKSNETLNKSFFYHWNFAMIIFLIF